MSAPAATGAKVNISRDVPQWTGDYRRYDLVKEFLAALAAMTLLTVVLAVVFGSPDKPSISLAEWANNDPNDFVVTAVAELDGTSGTATYGAPYTDDPSAGLDGRLLAEKGFYQTDYAKPLLFLADGGYVEDQARAEHLGGDQWGMMNETGRYPGQAWLWLYTFWYQIPPFNHSDNADALVWALMMVLSLALVLLPFIPGLRSIPGATRVYRLIWRDHYRQR